MNFQNKQHEDHFLNYIMISLCKIKIEILRQNRDRFLLDGRYLGFIKEVFGLSITLHKHIDSVRTIDM